MSYTLGAYGLAIKVDVSSIKQSIQWYQQVLGVWYDQRNSQLPYWARLVVPGMQNVVIGLTQNQSGAAGTTGAEVTTFIVGNIGQTLSWLQRNNVRVSGIQTIRSPSNPWSMIQLAYFWDPDGNRFGLRQDPQGF